MTATSFSNAIRRKGSALPFIFFLCTFLIGIFSYKPYGTTYDEPVQRQLGLATWNYVTGGNDSLLHLINKYHDDSYELFLTLPEKIFHLQTGEQIYHSRHLMNYLVFWIGSVFFFLLAKRIFRKQQYGLLAVLLLYLTPRFFAHAFYNSKDIPLMVFFIISFYLMVLFFEKPSWKITFWFALASGFLFGIRNVGIIVPVFTFGFCILNVLHRRLPGVQVKFLLAYLFIYVLSAYLFYPVIWLNPINGILDSFRVMSHYPFDTPMLFMGKMISPLETPWYYIPVWMGITIPLLWLLAFIIGMIVIIMHLFRRKSLPEHRWKILLPLGWLFIPWLMVIMLHSTVYDEWRHLFFIYPAFLLIAVLGIKKVINVLTGKKMLFSFFLLSAGSILFIWQIADLLYFMIKDHPHEFVYFNKLAGSDPGKKFDLDYWGLSYRDGLQYLLQHDSSHTINVCWQNAPGFYNLAWFTPEEQKRLHETPWDSCAFFLTNYRLHPEDFNRTDEFYSVRVGDLKILSIFRINHSQAK